MIAADRGTEPRPRPRAHPRVTPPLPVPTWSLGVFEAGLAAADLASQRCARRATEREGMVGATRSARGGGPVRRMPVRDRRCGANRHLGQSVGKVLRTVAVTRAFDKSEPLLPGARWSPARGGCCRRRCCARRPEDKADPLYFALLCSPYKILVTSYAPLRAPTSIGHIMLQAPPSAHAAPSWSRWLERLADGAPPLASHL